MDMCAHAPSIPALPRAAAFPFLFGMSCPLLSGFFQGLFASFMACDVHLGTYSYSCIRVCVSQTRDLSFSDSSTHCDNIF